MKHNVFIVGIGSNSFDRESQMKKTIEFITNSFENIYVSEIYETPAENGKDAPYINAVLVATTEKEMVDVNAIIKQWECNCGRTTMSKLEGIIPIDIDIVTWNEDVVRPKDFSKTYFTKGLLQLICQNI